MPLTGASWRASATSEANPLPRLAAAPRRLLGGARLAAHNAVARAWAAAAADFSRSNCSTCARSAASPAARIDIEHTFEHKTDATPGFLTKSAHRSVSCCAARYRSSTCGVGSAS